MKLTTTALVKIVRFSFFGIFIIANLHPTAHGEVRPSKLPVKQACFPGPNEVSVFQHKGFNGICSILPIGLYPQSRHMRMANDSISSIRVGRKVQIEVCARATSSSEKLQTRLNKCQIFTQSITNLTKTKVGNDNISSAHVKVKEIIIKPIVSACTPQKDQIAIHQHPDFKGNCRILGIGSYENSKRMNFKNDSVSSIEFSPKSTVTVVVCQHGNFKGRCETITTSDTKLSNNQIGNNSISSMKVIRK